MLDVESTMRCDRCEEGRDHYLPNSEVRSRVVLLHINSRISNRPVLFILPEEKLDVAPLSESIKDFFFHHHESFTSVGAVTDINKEKKLILLSSGHVIS